MEVNGKNDIFIKAQNILAITISNLSIINVFNFAILVSKDWDFLRWNSSVPTK